MINVKCFLLRLYLFIYSPNFIIALTTFSFIAYRICFEPVVLCDGGDNGWSLFNLKLDLTRELSEFRVNQVRIHEYVDRLELIKGAPSLTDSLKAEQTDYNQCLDRLVIENKGYVQRIAFIENRIKLYEPRFQSFISRPLDCPHVSHNG